MTTYMQFISIPRGHKQYLNYRNLGELSEHLKEQGIQVESHEAWADPILNGYYGKGTQMVIQGTGFSLRLQQYLMPEGKVLVVKQEGSHVNTHELVDIVKDFCIRPTLMTKFLDAIEDISSPY